MAVPRRAALGLGRTEGRFKADNGEAIRQAAIAGLGASQPCPPSWSRLPSRTGLFTSLLPGYPLTEAGLYLVRPPGTPVPGKIRALTDLLLERFGGEPCWDACQMMARRLPHDSPGDIHQTARSS